LTADSGPPYLAGGLSNAEIAGTLFSSQATVRTHFTRVLMKLDLRDRAQAVVLAYETGLVRPERHLCAVASRGGPGRASHPVTRPSPSRVAGLARMRARAGARRASGPALADPGRWMEDERLA
jgi:hypothetical protein